MDTYLKETKILDYSNASIQKLLEQRGWENLDTVAKVQSIYNFVRDEIKFGYNVSDYISASQVLNDGYGQCNTKATLLMALLRATDVPNRIHGFTIDKALQKGAITGIWYRLSPKNILHSWVEVWVNEQWYFLEGVILDKPYLTKLQEKNSDCKTTFCGFGFIPIILRTRRLNGTSIIHLFRIKASIGTLAFLIHPMRFMQNINKN